MGTTDTNERRAVGARIARDATADRLAADRSESSDRSIARSARSYSAAIAVLLACPIAHAEFSSEVTAGISHTDNVRLEPVDEDTELVYRLEPSFHFSKEAASITLNADYRLQALRYRDFGETDVYHQYDANLRAMLVPETFFLAIGANRSQTIVDPERRIPLSNLPISSNRQDRDEYYAEPSFQYAISNNISASGEYRHTWLEYGETGAEDSRQGDARFSLDNYARERGLTWALSYDWQRAEYELEIPWEYQKAVAELGFWVGAQTRFFAAAGKESAWDEPLDPAMRDDLWEAGFSHEMGERLSAEFAVGERSFGSSWRGNLVLKFRRGTTTLSYSEVPTTEGRVRYHSGTFDVLPIRGDFLGRPGRTERFIAKRLLWTLEVELRRTTVRLALFDTERALRTDAGGTPLGDESQRGGNLGISYQLGARTSLKLAGAWVERELQRIGTSELIHASVSIDYQLGSRTTLSLGYDYGEEDPESTLSVRDYVANTVSLDITRAF